MLVRMGCYASGGVNLEVVFTTVKILLINIPRSRFKQRKNTLLST